MDGGYSIYVKGNYIGGLAGNNTLKFDAANGIKNLISYDVTNKCTVVLSDEKDCLAPLQFNSAKDQMRFRYFGKKNGGQKSIQLYKLISE